MDNNVLVLMNMLRKKLTEKEFHYSNIADNLTETICSYINKLSKSEHSYQFVNDLKNIIYDTFSNVDFNLTKEIEDLATIPFIYEDVLRKLWENPILNI